jgi:ABC-type uncharacterized transport system involved in gliding motility auxiliary subunit
VRRWRWLILLLGVGVLLVASQRLLGGVRLDLTQDRIYTLSEGTRTTLRTLAEPIRLELVISRRAAAGFPSVEAYARQVEDLLTSYARASGGRLTLVVTTPEPFSDAEDAALAAGLTGLPTPSGETILFGLIGTNSVNGRAVIPLFTPERAPTLEYDLTRLVAGLAEPVRPRLTILTSLPLAFGLGGPIAFTQGQSFPNLIYEQLRQSFEVTLLDPRFTALPADTRVLMLALPPALSTPQVATIDGFVQGGGRVLALADPVSEVAGGADGRLAANPFAPARSASLEPLLSAWGAALVPDQVVGDGQLAQAVQFGPQTQIYLPWLGVSGQAIASGDLITQGLGLIRLAAPGALAVRPPPGVVAAPLLSSSDQAGLIPATDVVGGDDPVGLIQRFRPTGRYPLAVRLTGSFPSVVTPDARSRSTTIIVIADSDVLDDQQWANSQTLLGERVFSATADNASLILNAVDVLMGTNALLSLRSRAPASRPFTQVEARRAEAEQTLRQREAALIQTLQATEQQIAAIETAGGDGRRFLTPEQTAQIARLRASLLASRGEMREVQRALRQSVRGLEQQVIAANLLAGPVQVGLGAGLLWWRRRRMA